MNTFEKTIKAHLDKVAETDAAFAEKYNPEGIAGCCKYITAEAKKRAQNGCAIIADEEVYGWAVHYFDEGLDAPKEEIPVRVQTTADPNVMRIREAEKPIQALKQALKPKKGADDAQMSLFNFDEE